MKKTVGIGMGLIGLGWLLKHLKPSSKNKPSGPILVTGAGSGIGLSIAQVLVGQGYTVIGTVRKESQAQVLKSANIQTVFIDFESPESIATGTEEIKSLCQTQNTGLGGLVNNAGIALTGPVEMLSSATLRKQFQVNVFGLFELTQKLLPFMSPDSKIIQISSITGETTQPLIGAYSASKHALEALSTALRRELQLINKKIEVIVVQPGSVETPIWLKLEQSVDLEQYKETPYENLSQTLWKRIEGGHGKRISPSHVAQAVLQIFKRKRNAPLYIVSNNWPEEVIIPRLIPDRWLDKVFQRLLKDS